MDLRDLNNVNYIINKYQTFIAKYRSLKTKIRNYGLISDENVKINTTTDYLRFVYDNTNLIESIIDFITSLYENEK